MTLTSRRDRSDVTAAFDRHRRELHVHCYRMTGSFTDAEDLTQETFLRAWRSLDGFEGRASVRSWLYHIATNACLDFLKRHERRTTPVGNFADPLEHDTRLQPYPDRLLGEPSTEGDPDAALARRETTELVFVAALAVLPPRQRAALIARDVLEYSAGETAALLGVSVASANSLVQRARAGMRRSAPGPGSLWETTGAAVDGVDAVDDELVRRYVDAHQRGDAEAIVGMLHQDIRITMPPERPCIGLPEAAGFFRQLLGPDGPGDWLLVPTRANGRPATANYLRRPGDGDYRALSIDVLTIEDHRLVAVNCFLGDTLFPAFDLPASDRGRGSGLGAG
jgi:RNA polymerase sigma-70 factor (TIGR02960 family)